MHKNPCEAINCLHIPSFKHYTIYEGIMNEIINNITKVILNMFPSKYLSVFFVSFVPLIEARGAVPIALSMGLNPFEAIFFSSIGALFVCPLLLIVLEPLFNYLKSTRAFRVITMKIERIFKNKADGIEKKSSKTNSTYEYKKDEINVKRKLWLLYLFVAVPLPLTGVWSGSTIAVFLSLPRRKSLVALILGNFTASTLLCLLSLVLGKNSYIILLILLLFIVISIFTIIFKLFFDKKEKA